MSAEEFQKELARTRKKTISSEKIGEDFPDFALQDIRGREFRKSELVGKVVVVNYWFIGCTPCEMERAELNRIYSKYQDNPEVVFLSFARNNKEQLEKFLAEKEFLYPVIPLNKELIELFGLKGYPVNQVIDKKGKYSFNSSAAGIGSGLIIEEAIEKAL